MYGCLTRRQTQLDDSRPVNHYRCHLIRINSPCKTDEVMPGYAKVCLIDYGDQQIVDIRNIFNITKELEEHPTVCRYTIKIFFVPFFSNASLSLLL